MTKFEEFAKEINVPILKDKYGWYTGITKALANATNEIILSDNDRIFNLDWEEQKEMIKERFYKTFPYMKK